MKRRFMACILFFFCISILSCKNTTTSNNLDQDKSGFFTQIRETYIDKALSYEGVDDSDVRSASDVKSFTEKCDLLINLVNSKSARSLLNENDDSDLFYVELSNQFSDEVAGSVLISYLDSQTEDSVIEHNETLMTIMGYGFSVPELLDFVEKSETEVATDALGADRSLYKVDEGRWPNSLYYRFEDSVTSAQRTQIRSAMDEWESASGDKLSFVEIDNSGWNQFVWWMGLNYHLRIYTDSSDANVAGSATVGYGAWKSLKIANPDARTYRHELGHVLGLMHEHQRYDRDEYITINYDNIKPKYKHNFDIIGHGYDVTLDVVIEIKLLCFYVKKVVPIKLWWHETSRISKEMDFDSVMMYPSSAFSKNDKNDVMLKKDGSIITRPLVLSETDKEAVFNMYN